MAMEDNTSEEKSNGEVIIDETKEDSTNFNKSKGMNIQENEKGVTLFDIFNHFVSAIFSSDNNNNDPLIQRIKVAISENVPLIHQASKNTTHNVYSWTRKGSPLRALLVVSVGTIALLALTGLLVFMLFFVAATVNAIVISLLMSLAAAGGFLALFFACLTAIYIGALSVAVFVISTTTIITIIAVIVATGWIGFFWAIWLVTKKSACLAKHSLNVTGSALSAYSSARHFQHNHDA
ncbi:PREDICTED: uncharacterized protein LOC109239163 [Nicotiana attenuata]|uniref:Uncharacterized protein n=1 Tax=Nicotiana attenuata TaxID=49451 RepID=A0A314LAI5_NICAT|nr:PREDICTED: uncharacterized protein LOC109239163 [Nicotiana attenuata]OIT38625.1 hypothetical protein A4A49_09159 [Nicotiana attenuata]